MSCNVNNFIDCPNLQVGLAGLFGKLSSTYREMNPFTGFLISPVNTDNTLQKQIDSGNGHIRTVEVRYQSRLTEDQVTSSAVQDCTGGQKPGETSHQYEIDPTVGSEYKWTIAFDDLVRRCEDDENWFARQMQMGIDVICRAINTKNWQQASTLIGNFATTGNANPIHIATKNSAGVYVGSAMEDVRFEYTRMDYSGSVALFSSSKEFYNYFHSQMGMCCNTTFGMDLPTLFKGKDLVPFDDRKAGTYLGDPQDVLAMAPGALQFLTWNQYKGMQVITSEVYKQGLIMDPYTNLVFDYLATFNCGTWNFQLKLAHKLVAMPSDMFCADDRMHGVTWVNKFLIVNP